MLICEKLRLIRMDNNLTQKELADALCLSRTVITKFEKGYSVPNINTIQMISNYFKTNMLDEYKNKFKLFILSLKCVIPYLISILLLIISSLCLVTNMIKVNNEYGYNIYNDELKVKNCDYIFIAKHKFINDEKSENVYYSTSDFIYSDKRINVININSTYINTNVKYYLVIIELDNLLYNSSGQYCNIINISHKPFIYPLKDYNEFLPYNAQTGECKEILNYYIDLIEKVK